MRLPQFKNWYARTTNRVEPGRSLRERFGMSQNRLLPAARTHFLFRSRALRNCVTMYCVILLLLMTQISVTFVFSEGVQKVQAATGINKQINFQGRAVKPDGTIVPDGSYDFEFKVYSSATGGSALWTETWTAANNQVVIANGLFRVSLGSHAEFPASIDFNTDSLYLGVNMNNDGEMSPRVRFTSVPQAFNALKVNGLTVTASSGTLTIPDGKTITFGGDFTTSGGHALTLTTTGTTNATLPAGTVTLVDTASSQTLSNKSFTAVSSLSVTGTVTGGSLTDGTATLNGGVVTGAIWQGNTIGVAYGGTGISSYTTGDLLYASASTTLSKLGIGAAGECLTVSGTAPAWGSCGGAASVTLQAAYDNGGAITTASNKDIDFTLANSATDSNLDIQIATDSTSTVSISRVAGVGTSSPSQLLVVEDLDADLTIADGVTVRTSGVITDAIDVSDAEIVNALNIGTNNIVTGATIISSTELDRLDAKDAALVDTNDAVATAITGVGTITAGVWNGTAILDTYIADTLTVDSSSSVTWSALTSYPSACGAGTAITALGDTPTCSTFNSDATITLQDAYDATGGSSIVTANNRDLDITLSDFTTDPNVDIVVATNATGYVSITRADGSGSADPAQLILVDNLDTDRPQPIGIKLQSAAGALTTAIDASDAEIATALAIGSNDITTTSTTISAVELDRLDGKDAALVDTNDAVNTAITGVGTITTGVWDGTDILDAAIADTLTVGASSSVTWSALTSYPVACSAGNAITALDDTPTCSPFAGGTTTLQSAYDATSGNSISTTNNRDIDIILTDFTTDPNLDISVATNATGYVSITRADGGGSADPAQLVLIDNLDTDRPQPIGLKLQSASGALTTAIDATDGEIGTALAIGSNDITTTSTTISAVELDRLDGKDAALVDTNDAVNTAITGVGTIGTGTWNATAIGAAVGGTGINTASSTGVATVSSGTWSIQSALGATLGGTGQTSVTTGDLLYGSATNTWSRLADVAVGSVLVAGGVGAAPSWSSSPTLSTSLTVPLINTSSADLALQPSTGIVKLNTSSTQNKLRVFASDGAKYIEVTHDGTNSVITSSSGEVQIGASSGDVYIGSVGTAANLVFEESSTISGQGANTITLGQSGDTFNLNVSGATYNVGTLSSTGATVSTSSASTTALTVNGPTSLTANLLDLQVNGSSKLSVNSSGAITAIGVTSNVSGAAAATFNRTSDDGTIVSLKQEGTEEGAITVSGATVTYGGFTGAHYAWTDEVIERGMIVYMTGVNRYLHNNPQSEILYGVSAFHGANSKQILGVYLGVQNPSQPMSNSNPHLIMAVGNGDMWVVDRGQNVSVGDSLISSSVRGHGMRDTGEYKPAYVFAKAAEEINWDDVTETINDKGIVRKHKKISVLFDGFNTNQQIAGVAITTTGFLGVGTGNALRKLDVLDSNSPQLRLTQSNANAFTDLQTNNYGNFTILPSGGRIGVGTTDPQGTLDVRQNDRDTVALNIRAVANNKVDLIRITSSNSDPLFVVDATGKIATAESLPGMPVVGVDPNSGSAPGDLVGVAGPLKPVASGSLRVKISQGSAYTANSYENQSRVSRCVLESDKTIEMGNNTVEFIYITAGGIGSERGVTCEIGKSNNLPSFNPSKPVVVLAKVTTALGSILTVQDTRFFVGGTLEYTNTTALIEPGSIVVTDTNTDNAVRETAFQNEQGVSGIVVVGNSNAGRAIIMTRGSTWAKSTSGTLRSSCGGTSVIPGSLTSISSGQGVCVGQIKTNASPNSQAVLVNVRPN